MALLSERSAQRALIVLAIDPSQNLLPYLLAALAFCAPRGLRRVSS